MAWWDKANKQPLEANKTQAKLKFTPKLAVVHSLVIAPRPGKRMLDMVVNGFKDSGKESHFVLESDGTVTQLMDSEVWADAQKGANDRAISMETEDDGNPDATRWTDRQVSRIVEWYQWCSKTHGIPLRVALSPTESGVGYHSLHKAWNSLSKTCPGTVRVEQWWTRIAPAIGADRRGGPSAFLYAAAAGQEAGRFDMTAMTSASTVGGTWEETLAGGTTFTFREVTRGKDHVELRDDSRGKEVRLTDKTVMVRSVGSKGNTGWTSRAGRWSPDR
jgi:hypothetical protein